MRIKLRAKLILCGILSVVTVGALGVLSRVAHAEEEIERGKIVLLISPASVNVGELEPGGTYSGNFTVVNDGTEEFDYKIYTTGYKVEGEDYKQKYPEEESTYNHIQNWVSFSQTSGHLKPKERHEVSFTINVPQNTPAGGEYAAIMIETEDSVKHGGNIAGTTRLGLLLYSHVAGDTNECAEIVKTNIPGFLVNPPITASSVVKNCGNVELKASYTMRVFPLFSDEEIYTTEDNPDTKLILPETQRYNSISWDQAPALGIYRVEEVVKIADKEETLSKLVVICPLWLIVLIIVFIGAVIFWLVSRNRERKQKAEQAKMSGNTKINKEK